MQNVASYAVLLIALIVSSVSAKEGASQNAPAPDLKPGVLLAKPEPKAGNPFEGKTQLELVQVIVTLNLELEKATADRRIEMRKQALQISGALDKLFAGKDDEILGIIEKANEELDKALTQLESGDKTKVVENLKLCRTYQKYIEDATKTRKELRTQYGIVRKMLVDFLVSLSEEAAGP